MGLKILLNTSIFVANITRPKANPNKKNANDFISQINIVDIPTATNSAKIVVSGTAVNYKKLNFYLNDELVKDITPQKDEFSEVIDDLKEGSNELYISGKANDSNKSSQTSLYTVYYKKEKPKLDISEPQDNSTVYNNELKVAGATDKEISIKINQLPVVVDASGNFQTIIRLNEGENKITIEAQDTAGNVEKKELKVTYSKD